MFNDENVRLRIKKSLTLTMKCGKLTGNGLWLSLVEHRVRDAGAAGSNPVNPTISGKRHGAFLVMNY